MQNLGISPRAVRFAGDCGSKDESMADTYMREAQLLVLKVQEMCLHTLRSGTVPSDLVGAGRAVESSHGAVDGGAPPAAAGSQAVIRASLRSLPSTCAASSWLPGCQP